MSRVKFSVYDTPSKNSKDACARLVSSGTKHMKEVCTYINESCSINSSDIKGVLDALSKFIGHQLSYGYTVELEGLGYFSPALKTKKERVNEKGNTVFSVSVEGVNFRCSPELKEMVKDCRPQKVKRENKTTTSREERKALMLDYLKSRRIINVSDYVDLNKCTHYAAKNDMKQFVEDGLLETEGYRTHRVYKLVEKKGEEEGNAPETSKPLPERIRIAGKIDV